MSKGIHRSWGYKDILFYCPKKEVVWQYDNSGKIHKYPDMPTYGLERRVLK